MYALCKRRSYYLAMMFKKNPGVKNKVHRLDVRFIFCIYLMKKNIIAPCAPGC